MKISEHLYIYLWSNPRDNNCNTVVIDGKVPLLVDPGLNKYVSPLFQRMKQDGFDSNNLKLVICTHGHPDHLEGALGIKSASVKMAMSQEEERYILDAGAKWYASHGNKMPDFSIDFYLKDGNLILGKHEFEIIMTPGHSPGGISIYWPKFKTLFTGDTVFMKSVGRVDLPGGNPKLLKRSVEELSKLKVELLIPGHGPAVQGASNVKANFDFIKKMLANVH
jgi:glyoxylase-like metal-dependent hydrolase (beta-lactamase superfamily II)